MVRAHPSDAHIIGFRLVSQLLSSYPSRSKDIFNKNPFPRPQIFFFFLCFFFFFFFFIFWWGGTKTVGRIRRGSTKGLGWVGFGWSFLKYPHAAIETRRISARARVKQFRGGIKKNDNIGIMK